MHNRKMNHLIFSIRHVVVGCGCDIGQFIPSQAIKLAMGGQASLLDGPHKGPRPNKRNVTGSALNVINNKSQLSETDLAARMDVEETSVRRESTSIYVNHSLESGLLLLREAINLSENSVTQAQTKEHFGDVQQVLRQMTLIRLVLMGNLQK